MLVVYNLILLAEHAEMEKKQLLLILQNETVIINKKILEGEKFLAASIFLGGSI